MGATIAMARAFTARQKLATIGVFLFLANVPDLPFPGWGHDRYDISVTVFFTTAVLAGVVAAAFLCVKGLKQWAGGARMIWAGVGA